MQAQEQVLKAITGNDSISFRESFFPDLGPAEPSTRTLPTRMGELSPVLVGQKNYQKFFFSRPTPNLLPLDSDEDCSDMPELEPVHQTR